MKKFLKIVLPIITVILTLLFVFRIMTVNYTIWNVTFLCTLAVSLLTQFIHLDNFKILKRVLFMLLTVLLTLISLAIIVFVPALLFPVTDNTAINIIGNMFFTSFSFFNLLVAYPILDIFFNRFKKNEKSKKSYIILIILYFLAITIIETALMCKINVTFK